MLGTMILGCMACFAAIIPPLGPGQIGFSSVVLCDSLSLYSEPNFSSTAIQTLKYGDRIIVMNQENGWAKAVLGDSEDATSGWVAADYIAVDPAWYRMDKQTPVYAWNDTSAPKVALLDEGTTLPILKDNGDWLIISLRGATGWINNPDRKSTTAAADTAQSNSGSNGENEQKEGQSVWFTVYAKDGSTVSIHWAEGAMYEDEKGRTYVKQAEDGFYYCITTDITYAFDMGAWTGEAYGENEFPGEADDESPHSGEYYGENQDLTGEDYGENQDLTGEDYGENQDVTGEYYGENQDLTGEDYGENQGWTGEDFGENQG